MRYQLILILMAILSPLANAIDYTPLKKALLNEDAKHYQKPYPYPFYAQTGLLAFSVNDQRFCSPRAAYEIMLSERKSVKVQTAQGVETRKTSILADHRTYQYTHKQGHKRRINVGQSIEMITKNYNFILNQFISNGDPALSHRHFCVGFMDVHEPDAKSALEGIILFDPRFYQLLDEFNTDMHSQAMIELHELAHQLQFIHKMQVTRDPNTGEAGVTDLIGEYVNNDKTVKRFELTADCMAAAMTTLLYPVSDSFGASGLMMAGVAYGDFYVDSPQHHGQPLERAVAVRRGIDIMKKQPKRKWHSKELVNACEAQVKDIRTLGSMMK